MIHEVGVELGTFLQGTKGCPIPVVDGPEFRPTTTFARERIVIEHDFGSPDSFGPKHQANKNPSTRLTRVMACKITIYAKNPRPGAPYWEHVRRCEHVLDLVLNGLYHVASARQNIQVPKSGKFILPPDLKDSETPGGAVYELLFSFDRGVTNANWNGTPPAETVTVTPGFIVTTTEATAATQDGGTSTETAT